MAGTSFGGRRNRHRVARSLRLIGALALLASFWLPLAGVPVAWADGELDSDFDGDGKLTTDFGGAEHVQSVAIQSDGKIVAAGYRFISSDDIALARFNPDGSLDTAFSFDGKLTTDLGGHDFAHAALALQNDGKILIAGYSNASGNNDFALALYTPDGTLDSNFDGDGKVVTDFGATDYGEMSCFTLTVKS